MGRLGRLGYMHAKSLDGTMIRLMPSRLEARSSSGHDGFVNARGDIRLLLVLHLPVHQAIFVGAVIDRGRV